MALVDSAADFSTRVGQLGLPEHENRMAEVGVKTFAQLAFFSGFQPGGSEAGGPAIGDQGPRAPSEPPPAFHGGLHARGCGSAALG